MKILLLNTQMEAGGAQKALLELARGLMDRGHDVVVATMYDKGSFVPVFNQRYGLSIIDLQMKAAGGRATKVKSLARGLGQLRRMMRDEKFDVVQTFSHYSNIIGPLVAWTASVPVRVSSQRMSLRGAKRWVSWLDRFAANSPLVQRMTAVSEGTRDFSIEEEKIRPEKLVTIYNGIAVDRYDCSLSPAQVKALRADLGIGAGHTIVLTIARLHPQKGHTFLLQAIPQILRSQPETHFVFVGDGELSESLAAEVRKHNLSSCVHLVGVRQDIPELLAIADLFVLPSLWEGMPNSVLEAMAARLPVVSSDVDGCPEVVVDGQTGLLVPPGQPEKLARAILTVLEDQNLAACMGEAGYDRVRSSFSVEQNVSKYIDLYENLLPTERAR